MIEDFILPFPPSVNRYWRSVKGRVLLSEQGREYRRNVSLFCQRSKKFKKRELRVDITAYPPDRRRRDLDNLCKSLLDSLQHAGIYEDDFQISDLRIKRAEPVPGGKVKMTIEEVQH